jgi:hypothetical protein
MCSPLLAAATGKVPGMALLSPGLALGQMLLKKKPQPSDVPLRTGSAAVPSAAY